MFDELYRQNTPSTVRLEGVNTDPNSANDFAVEFQQQRSFEARVLLEGVYKDALRNNSDPNYGEKELSKHESAGVRIDKYGSADVRRNEGKKFSDIDAFDVENAFTRVREHSSQKLSETINLFEEKEVSKELEHIRFDLPNTEIEISGGLLSEKTRPSSSRSILKRENDEDRRVHGELDGAEEFLEMNQ